MNLVGALDEDGEVRRKGADGSMREGSGGGGRWGRGRVDYPWHGLNRWQAAVCVLVERACRTPGEEGIAHHLTEQYAVGSEFYAGSAWAGLVVEANRVADLLSEVHPHLPDLM